MFAMGPLLLAKGVGAAPPVAVTWNPADTNANLTLSGGNLVITRGAASQSTWFSSRANTGRSAGKRVFANTNTTVTASNDGLMTGLMTILDALTTFPGQNADSYGMHSINGRCYNNNTQVGTDFSPGFSTGDVILFAVDFAAGLIWVGGIKSGTATWSGNPAAGTGARFTFTAGATLYPACGQYRQPQVSTANFKPSTITGIAGVMPSGFSDW